MTGVTTCLADLLGWRLEVGDVGDMALLPLPLPPPYIIVPYIKVEYLYSTVQYSTLMYSACARIATPARSGPSWLCPPVWRTVCPSPSPLRPPGSWSSVEAGGAWWCCPPLPGCHPASHRGQKQSRDWSLPRTFIVSPFRLIICEANLSVDCRAWLALWILLFQGSFYSQTRLDHYGIYGLENHHQSPYNFCINILSAI